MQVQVFVSHILINLSFPPDINFYWSKSKAVTISLCPYSLILGLSDTKSQIMIPVSADPVYKVSPSSENTIELIPEECP